jgi:hypothetical protein
MKLSKWQARKRRSRKKVDILDNVVLDKEIEKVMERINSFIDKRADEITSDDDILYSLYLLSKGAKTKRSYGMYGI